MQAKRKMSCKEFKTIDIVDFLRKLGFHPSKINDKEAWYFSPIKKKEKLASFRVNRHRQLWYDYSLGEGGDIIKLGCRIYNCSVSELLSKVQNHQFSFSQPINISEEHSKIIVKSVGKITKMDLIKYIIDRGIKVEIANAFCRQINYSVGKFNFISVGFQNLKGGWELRNRTFKGATSKELSLIKNGSTSVCVFEGFFDMLSFIQLNMGLYENYDLLILNSLALINNAIEILKGYKKINLYLDNDDSGKGATQRILGLNLTLTIDHSNEYSNYKDLNELIIAKELKGVEGVKAR